MNSESDIFQTYIYENLESIKSKILEIDSKFSNLTAESVAKKPYVVVVDGLIACGKTTYLNAMVKVLTTRGWRVTLVKEPIEKWIEPGPNNSPSLFQLFNADPARWAYHFQTRAFLDRVNENKDMYEQYRDSTDIFILERSCFTDRLFMGSLYESGLVTDLEMRDYNDWCKFWSVVMPYTPDLFIYLRPPVDVCMQRKAERNRPGEEKITTEYQEGLQRKHDDFFTGDAVNISSVKNRVHFIPCVRVDTTENYRDNIFIQEKFATQFEGFIHEIVNVRKNM